MLREWPMVFARLVLAQQYCEGRLLDIDLNDVPSIQF